MSPVPEVRERVRRLLADWHGESQSGVDGALIVDLAEASVTVSVEPDADLVSVVLYTVVRSNVEQSDVLLRYVATQDYRLGSLRIAEEPDGLCTVTFLYSLLGETLDPDELRHAVETVASTTCDICGDLERLIGPDAHKQQNVAALTPREPHDGSRAPTVHGPVVGPLPSPTAPAGMTWFQGSIAAAVPPGWFAKESFTVLAPDGQANVILSSEPLDPSIDVERYAEVQGALLEKEFPEFREVASGDMVLSGGIPGRWRQFGWSPPDGVRVTQLQIYAVPVPGRGYTATATSTEASWERHTELLRFIVFQAVLRTKHRRAD